VLARLEALNPRCHVLVAEPDEGQISGDHLAEEETERPPVHGFAVVLLQEHLGRGERHGADHGVQTAASSHACATGVAAAAVAIGVAAAVANGIGAGVAVSGDAGTAVAPLCVRVQFFCEPEIGEFEVAVVRDQNVLRLKVAVDEVVRVHVRNRHRDFSDIYLGPLLWEGLPLEV